MLLFYWSSFVAMLLVALDLLSNQIQSNRRSFYSQFFDMFYRIIFGRLNFGCCHEIDSVDIFLQHCGVSLTVTYKEDNVDSSVLGLMCRYGTWFTPDHWFKSYPLHITEKQKLKSWCSWEWHLKYTALNIYFYSMAEVYLSILCSKLSNYQSVSCNFQFGKSKCPH